MRKKYVALFLVALTSLFLFTGCGKTEDGKEMSKEQDKQNEEKKDTTNYTTGIKDIKEALLYELGFWFYQGADEVEDYGIGSDMRVIDASTKHLKAQDLHDKLLTEFLYQYLSKQDDNYEKVWSEEEIKKALQDLYGDNYTYDHKLVEQSACTSLVYEEEKNGYYAEGGCGGLSIPSEPHVYIKILEETDTTVTLGRVYVVPSIAEDGYEAIAPYQIYQDETKKTLLGSVDNQKEAFTTLKDKVTKYLVTFDKDNGFYHFNNLKKVK